MSFAYRVSSIADICALFLSSMMVTYFHVSSSMKLSAFILTTVIVLREGLLAMVVLRWCSCVRGLRCAIFAGSFHCVFLLR